MIVKLPGTMKKLAAISAEADKLGISYGQYVALMYQGKILPPFPFNARKRKGS